MVLPIAIMITTSLKMPEKVFAIPVEWIPNPIRWENYSEAAKIAPLARYLFNSIFVGVGTSALILITSALAGYGFAKYRFKGRESLFIAVLSTMMIPFQVIMIPLFVIVRDFGWLNSYAGLILPMAVSAFGVFMMRQFILTIPNELIDAARIDGASEPRIFFGIILPLCKGPLTALGIITFLDNWNSLLWPLIIITHEEMRPFALGLSDFQNSYGTAYHYVLAAATVATLPILVAFLALQKQFIRGVLLSGMKG